MQLIFSKNRENPYYQNCATLDNYRKNHYQQSDPDGFDHLFKDNLAADKNLTNANQGNFLVNFINDEDECVEDILD